MGSKALSQNSQYLPTQIDSDLRGFSGGFLDGNRAYFVPFHNGRVGGAKLVRVDAVNFSSNSVEVRNLCR